MRTILSSCFLIVLSLFLSPKESMAIDPNMFSYTQNISQTQAYQEALLHVIETQKRISKIVDQDLFHHPERVQSDDVFTKNFLEGVEYAKNAMMHMNAHNQSPDKKKDAKYDSFEDESDTDEELFRQELQRQKLYTPRTIEAIVSVAENEKYKELRPIPGIFHGLGEDKFTLYDNPEDVAKNAYVAKQSELANLYLQKQNAGEKLTEYELGVIQDHSHFRQGELTHLAQTGVRGAAIGATILAPKAIGPIWGFAEAINGALDGLNNCHYAPSTMKDAADITVHTAVGASPAKGAKAMIAAGGAATAYGYATNNPELLQKSFITFTIGGVLKTIPFVKEWKQGRGDVAPAIIPQASNAHNLERLNVQLEAEEVVSWHGTAKHLHEFKPLGITTPTQLKSHVEHILQNPQTLVCNESGKVLYADPSTKTIIIIKTAGGVGEPTLFVAKDYQAFLAAHSFKKRGIG